MAGLMLKTVTANAHKEKMPLWTVTAKKSAISAR